MEFNPTRYKNFEKIYAGIMNVDKNGKKVLWHKFDSIENVKESRLHKDSRGFLYFKNGKSRIYIMKCKGEDSYQAQYVPYVCAGGKYLSLINNRDIDISQGHELLMRVI